MKSIAEVGALIDELEAKLESYSDKTVWQKSNVSEWYPWILEEGPKIIESWRELAALIKLTTGDQLIDLMNRWESIQKLAADQEVLSLAVKFNRRNTVPPMSSEQ